MGDLDESESAPSKQRKTALCGLIEQEKNDCPCTCGI